MDTSLITQKERDLDQKRQEVFKKPEFKRWLLSIPAERQKVTTRINVLNLCGTSVNR